MYAAVNQGLFKFLYLYVSQWKPHLSLSLTPNTYERARERESALREGLHALRAQAVCMGQDVDFQ
jgi:hypothetical protein